MTHQESLQALDERIRAAAFRTMVLRRVQEVERQVGVVIQVVEQVEEGER